MAERHCGHQGRSARCARACGLSTASDAGNLSPALMWNLLASCILGTSSKSWHRTAALRRETQALYKRAAITRALVELRNTARVLAQRLREVSVAHPLVRVRALADG